jgi:tape measure domain-containing protein
MATSIGHLAVLVSANTAGFSAGLAQASKGAQGFASTIGGMARSVGVVVGLGTAFEGVKKAFTGFASLEQNKIAFETLLGSAAQAKTMLQDLTTFAATTPFQLPELQAAAKQLVAFGFAGDEVVPSLRRIGDLAAGLGQPVGELTFLFAQARANGRLMGQDIRELSNRGVPIVAELAKQFGVSESAVRDLVSEGKVGFPELQKALVSMTSEGGKFFDLTKKQSQSLGGLWSTFTDAIDMSLTTIGEGIVKAFDVKAIVAWMGEAVGAVANWVGTIGPYLEAAAAMFMGLFDTVTSIFRGIGSFIKSVLDVVGTMFSGFGESSLNDFVKAFQIGALTVQFTFNNLGDYFKLFVMQSGLTLVGWFLDMGHWFTVKLPEMIAWFGRNWVEVFRDIFNWTTTIFSNMANNIWQVFSNLPGLISGTVSWDEVWKPLTDGFVPTIKEQLKLTERELTDWEKGMQGKVGALGSDLAARRAAFIAEGMAKLVKAEVPEAALPDALKPGGVGSVPATQAAEKSKRGNEVKFAGAFEAGSKEAYNLILASRQMDRTPMEKTAKATADTAKNTGDIKEAIGELDDAIRGIEGFGVGSIDAPGDFG